MNNQKGLTLLEILVGVSIFAVSLSIAAGIFSGTSRYQKKAEVSRSIDEDVRQIVEQISDDIRNSKGIVMINSDNIYYNFVGLDNYLIKDSKPNGFNNKFRVLRVNLDDNHRRQYYLKGQSVMLQDMIYVKDGIAEGWQKDGSPQSISTDNIIVSNLFFRTNTARQDKLVDQAKLFKGSYPYVEFGFRASYDNKKDLAELFGEQVEVDTMVSPRNFSYID